MKCFERSNRLGKALHINIPLPLRLLEMGIEYAIFLILILQVGLIEVYDMLEHLNSRAVLYGDVNIDGDNISQQNDSVKCRVIFEHCVQSMVLPVDETASSQYVLLTGACQDKGRIYMARVRPNTGMCIRQVELYTCFYILS